MAETHIKEKHSKKASKPFRTVFLLIIFLTLLVFTGKYTVAAFKINRRQDAVITDRTDLTNPFEGYSKAPESAGAQSQVFSPEPMTLYAEATAEPSVEATPAPTPKRINPVPDSGTVFGRRFADQCCTVRAINALETDCCVVMIQKKTDVTALSFFLKAGEQADVLTPNGDYRFVVETGDTWISDDKFFGTRTEEFALETELSLPWGSTDVLTVERPLQ